MPDAHANFASSTVAIAPSPALSGTTLTLATGEGALFPAFPCPGYNCVAGPAAGQALNSNAEIIRITNRVGDVLTFVRGPQAGDPAGTNRAILVGDVIYLADTVKSFTDIETNLGGALQNGVLDATNPAPTVTVTNSGTAALSYTLTAAMVWVSHPSVSGALVPVNFAGVAGVAVTPGTLPAAGKYRGYGLELDSNGAISLIIGGADQTTAALALANVNTVPAAGKVRLCDFVLLNTAGVYSRSGSVRDRRPWARGLFSQVTSASDYTVSSSSLAVIDSTNLSVRAECSGVPVRVKLDGPYFTQGAAGGTPTYGLWVDGVQYGGVLRTGTLAAGQWGNVAVEWIYLPAAGSHLFQPYVAVTASTGTLAGTGGAIRLIVEELPVLNANNGTS